MRLLFLGDLMGRSGRTAAINALPDLREKLKLDFVVVNGENAASGFGTTSKIAGQVIQAGADVLSGGNHTFDQKELLNVIDNDTRILRPVNYPPGTPGRGFAIYDAPRGKKVLVINAMGRVFMNALECPFRAVDDVLKKYRLGATVNAICPGWVKTEQSLRSITEMSGQTGRSVDDIADELLRVQAIDGHLEPEDMVSGYLFLASDLARDVTGQSLHIDRGELMY